MEQLTLLNFGVFMGFNQFHATGLFQYPLKTFENLWLSDDFRLYRKKPMPWNRSSTWKEGQKCSQP